MPAQHIDDDGRHVDNLDRRLRDLSASYVSLGDDSEFQELFQIIHRPGWTTVIDVFFMNVLVDAADRNAEDARRLREALLEGARVVGDASAEA